MGDSANGMVLVQHDMLEELTERLQQDFPKSLTVLGSIHFIARGRLEGQVYTNGWPNFSAVVCQYKGTTTQWFFCCYTAKTEDLACLLHTTKLLHSTQKNGFLVDSTVASALVKQVKFVDVDKVGTEFSSTIQARLYYLPNIVKEPRACPAGYQLRQLEEHHADFVSQHWTHMNNVELRKEYVRSSIVRFHSLGVFVENKADTPIAWCLQHPFGQLGHLYVTEGYRRHGFACLLAEHMCQYIQDDGAIPQAAVEWRNTPCMKLMSKLGFVERNMHTFFSICGDSSTDSVF